MQGVGTRKAGNAASLCGLPHGFKRQGNRGSQAAHLDPAEGKAGEEMPRPPSGLVAQLAEQLPPKLQVVGSIPTQPAILASSSVVEQRPVKAPVVGSIPTWPASIIQNPRFNPRDGNYNGCRQVAMGKGPDCDYGPRYLGRLRAGILDGEGSRQHRWPTDGVARRWLDRVMTETAKAW